jgi:hypothetical protein
MTLIETIAQIDTAALDGEAAAAAEAREARRLRRLESVELMRLAAEQMAVRLNEGLAGRLFGEEHEAFEKVDNPYLAYTRVSRTFHQLILLEERLDEDAETREARIAAERAEQAQRIAEAQKRREAEAVRVVVDHKATSIRKAVRAAHRDAYPEMEHPEREMILDAVFEDFEEIEDYDGDAAGIVARLCHTLDMRPDRDAEGNTLTDPDAIEDRAYELAEEYLRLVGYAPDGPIPRPPAAPPDAVRSHGTPGG